MSDPSFRVLQPKTRTSAVVVASPHSGRAYPDDFLQRSVLDSRGIRSSEDAWIDLLFEDVPAFGSPLILADAPRAWLDLNRSPDELDPAVIADTPRGALNPRVSSGLGIIPRVVANGRAIYRGKISRAEAKARIDNVWRPYHAALQNELDAARHQFGQAILLDVHSMPHEAIETNARQHLPHIVLGDRFGASASERLVHAVRNAFESEGFVVARNAPFAGAFIAQHYGRPSRNQHAIQIEIDRSLYMDEGTISPNANFERFKQRLTAVAERLVEIGKPQETSVAAE